MEELLNYIGTVVDNHAWLAPLIVLVWTFIEGETIVIFMGYLAQDGSPNVVLIILAAFAGSLAGDQTWFFVGRYHGKGFIARRPAWQQRAERVYALLHRHQNWLILGFRFLYGLRNVTPFAVGMSQVKTARFCILNTIGAAVWAVTFGMGGYLFGMTVAGTVGHLKVPILVGFVAVVATVWLTRTILRARRARRRQQVQDAQTRRGP